MQYDNLVALYRSPVPKFFTNFCKDNAETFAMDDTDSRTSSWSLKDTVLYNLFIFVNKFREYLAKTILNPLLDPELEFPFDLEAPSDLMSVLQRFGGIKKTLSDDYFEQFSPFYDECQEIPSFLTDKEDGYWDLAASFNNYSFDEEWSSYHPLYDEYWVSGTNSNKDWKGAIVSQEKEAEFRNDIKCFFCMFFGNEEAHQLSCYVLENAEKFKLFSFEKGEYPNKYYFDSDFLNELLDLSNSILEDSSSETVLYRKSALQQMYPNLVEKYGLENLFHILFPKERNGRNVPLSFSTWARDRYSYPNTGISVQISESIGFFLTHSLSESLSLVPKEDEKMRQDIFDFYHFFLLSDNGFIGKDCFCFFNLYNDTEHYLSTGLDGKNYYVTISIFTSFYGLTMDCYSADDEPRNYNIEALILLSIADKLYQRLSVYKTQKGEELLL